MHKKADIDIKIVKVKLNMVEKLFMFPRYEIYITWGLLAYETPFTAQTLKGAIKKGEKEAKKLYETPKEDIVFEKHIKTD